jgi:hypothetical protein
VIATVWEFERQAGHPVGWIIVDTKAQTLGGDENAAKEMGAYVRGLARLQAETGAHVTVVDHTPHDAPHRMRGHGGLLGAADSTFTFAKADGVFTVSADKVNDGPDDLCLTFTAEPVELGTDPDTGEVTTAPVAVPRTEPDIG